MIRSFFAWMDALPSSIALRESLNAYPTLLTLHILSMCLFAGLIALWDLRLCGFVLKKSPVSEISKRVFPWALTGFAISVITGGLLAYSKPLTYYTNFYFWLKNGLLVLAGINLVVFHLVTEKTIDQWNESTDVPGAVKFAGYASLVLWAAIVVSGRLMAYSGLVPDWWKALNLS